MITKEVYERYKELKKEGKYNIIQYYIYLQIEERNVTNKDNTVITLGDWIYNIYTNGTMSSLDQVIEEAIDTIREYMLDEDATEKRFFEEMIDMYRKGFLNDADLDCAAWQEEMKIEFFTQLEKYRNKEREEKEIDENNKRWK